MFLTWNNEINLQITFHGGLRLLLPSQKGVQVGSHGGFPKAFATRSSFSDLATSAQQQLSIGNTSYWFPNELNHLSGRNLVSCCTFGNNK